MLFKLNLSLNNGLMVLKSNLITAKSSELIYKVPLYLEPPLGVHSII